LTCFAGGYFSLLDADHGSCARASFRGPLYQLGYVDALRDDYRVILIDARGHGGSDGPHDPQAYQKQLMARDVIAVLDDLGIDKTHYLGYSMGGTIGFGLARFAPERLASLIIGGSHPYEPDPSDPNPVGDAWISLFRQGSQAYVDSIDVKYRHLFPPAESIDPTACIAWCTLRERAGLADGLSTFSVPCLLFVGENDPSHDGARRCADEMRNATFVSIPGADHLQAVIQPDLVLPHVKRFLAGVAQS
jgi:pimeloyl-ACP methyl ester carboxylesterase